MHLSYKFGHFRTNKKIWLVKHEPDSETVTSWLGEFNLKVSRALGVESPVGSEFQYKIDHISKTKIRKIYFSFVSEHFATYLTKNPD